MYTIKPITFFTVTLLHAVFVQGQDNWKKIENSSFSFSLPPSFKKTEARGIDSFVEKYVADGIEVSFDYGFYSNNFDDWPKDTKFEYSLRLDYY